VERLPVEARPGKGTTMCHFLRIGRQFLIDERAATATEYAVMLAMIVLACMGAVALLGSKVSDIFANTKTEFDTYYP